MDSLRLVGYVISKAAWFIRYSGRDNIPSRAEGGFIIASNHQTYIDPVWICLPMRRRLRFMAFQRAFEWRRLGPFIRYLGAFPSTTKGGATLPSIKEAVRALRSGAALTVFPEGGREFADGEFLPFKAGAVRIAMQAGVPILPVTIVGGNRIWPRMRKYPKLFRRVEVIYHPLIHPAEDPKLDRDQNLAKLTASLRKTILSAYRT